MLTDKIPYSGRWRKIRGRTNMWKETEANYIFFSVLRGERDQGTKEKWTKKKGPKKSIKNGHY